VGIAFCKPCPQLSTSNPSRTACGEWGPWGARLVGCRLELEPLSILSRTQLAKANVMSYQVVFVGEEPCVCCAEQAQKHLNIDHAAMEYKELDEVV
jgi:hypothetical protein